MVSKRTTNWLILLYVSTLTCCALGLPQVEYNHHHNHQQQQNHQGHSHHQQQTPQNQNQFPTHQNLNQFPHDNHKFNQLPVQALHGGNTNSISQSQFPTPSAQPPGTLQHQQSTNQFAQKLQQQQQAQLQQQAYLQNQQQNPFYQPQQQYQLSRTLQVPITSFNNELSHDGSFAYGYTTGDGQHAQAQGFVKNLGNKDLEAQVVQGAYSYTSPDGTPISVKYVADENGFRAEGLHLPTPPPIPEAIARALQYIARVQATNPQLYLQNQQQNPHHHQQLNQQQQHLHHQQQQQLQQSQQAAANQFTGNFNKLG